MLEEKYKRANEIKEEMWRLKNESNMLLKNFRGRYLCSIKPKVNRELKKQSHWLMLFFVFKMIMTKNSVMNDFQRSPILNEENTIRIYDEGLELIGSFEKVYAPWKSVYAVKETKKELIILPTLSRGVAVISKERYKNELEEIIKILKSKGVMK